MRYPQVKALFACAFSLVASARSSSVTVDSKLKVARLGDGNDEGGVESDSKGELVAD